MMIKVVESDQKILKIGIHNFPAWRSVLKSDSVKIGRKTKIEKPLPKNTLLCPWAKALNEIASTFECRLEDHKGHFAVSWPRQLAK